MFRKGKGPSAPAPAPAWWWAVYVTIRGMTVQRASPEYERVYDLRVSTPLSIGFELGERSEIECGDGIEWQEIGLRVV